MINLDKVAFAYQGHILFDQVSLTFARESVTAIVGPSGAGKTTLLKLLIGVTKPQRGSIRMSCPLTFGYMPQVDEVDWHFPITVKEVIALGLHQRVNFRSIFRSQPLEAITPVAARLGVKHLLGRPIRELSGGEQQRVFLARALVGQPDVLVLDEPTTGADVTRARNIVDLLLELNRETGLTVILTTHDLVNVAARLPRLICFNRGIIAQGSSAEVLRPEILKQTFGDDAFVPPDWAL